jgi:hypothetical protein
MVQLMDWATRLQEFDTAVETGNINKIVAVLRGLRGSADPVLLQQLVDLVADPSTPVAAEALTVLAVSGAQLTDGFEERLRTRLGQDVLLRSSVARALLYSDNKRAWDLLARLMDQPLFLECAVNEIGQQSSRRYPSWLTAVHLGLQTMPLSQASRDQIEYWLKRLEIQPLRGKKLDAFLLALREHGFAVDHARIQRLPSPARTAERVAWTVIQPTVSLEWRKATMADWIGAARQLTGSVPEPPPTTLVELAQAVAATSTGVPRRLYLGHEGDDFASLLLLTAVQADWLGRQGCELVPVEDVWPLPG